MQLAGAIAAAVAVASVLVLLYADESLAPKSVLLDKYADTSMHLKNIDTPVLMGASLQLFAFALRVPVLGSVIVNILKRQNNLIQLRELAAIVDDMPLYYPLHPPSSDERARHEGRSMDISSPYAPTSASSFRRYTIEDYTRRYRTPGDVTPVDVAHAVLDAIAASNAAPTPLLAVIASHRDEILRDAAASADRYASGNVLGPLDGVPVLIKDELDVAGHNTTAGTSFLGKLVGAATSDSIAVGRLRQNGAIIVGKTNMHEVGAGVTGLNQFYGPARNAYSAAHLAGGSSGGSAAAVGAGLVPLALGCDGGGSIRIPASFNGVTGVKATFMRIPELVRTDPSMANVGPIAATVQDAAVAYAVLSGSHPAVPMSAVQPPPHVSLRELNDLSSLRSLRIGVFPDAFVAAATDAAVLDQFRTHVRALEAAGATLVPVSLPHIQTIHHSHSMTILTEMLLNAERFGHFDEYSYEVQIAFALAKLGYSAADLLACQVVRGYATRLVKDLFTKVDVILTPTTAMTAPRLDPAYLTHGLSDITTSVNIMRFILLGNLVGVPSVAVPMGMAKSAHGADLPTSMLIQADHWNEDKALRVARAIETASSLPASPDYHYDILADADRARQRHALKSQ